MTVATGDVGEPTSTSDPSSASGLGVRGVLGVFGGEVVRVLAAGWRLVVGAPRSVALWALLVVGAGWWGRWSVVAALVVPVAVLGLWARCRPASFAAVVSGPSGRAALRRRLVRSWPGVAASCGLVVQVPDSGRVTVRSRLARPVSRRAGGARGVRWGASVVASKASGAVDEAVGAVVSVATVPALLTARGLSRVAVTGPVAVLRLGLVPGQTIKDVEAAAQPLATAWGAVSVRVEPDGVTKGRARVLVIMADVLGDVAPARVPDPAAPAPVAAPARVLVGRRADGLPWWVEVGPHTLVAGASGAGKGSVLWGLVCGLAPASAAGLVRVHGIDLKGGVELGVGRGLFCRVAKTPEQALVVLEDLVEVMRARLVVMEAAGVRKHEPTSAEPLHVVIIDELAALTAYLDDRDLQRRAEVATNLLQSQGRAPGVALWAFVQDPRKDVVPSRGLFQQFVGLRLADESETGMVMGDRAADNGGECHHVPRTRPGSGYVIPTGGGHPIGVRADWVDDDMIRAAAAACPSPVVEPIVVPEPAAEDDITSWGGPRQRTPRRPRAPRDTPADTVSDTTGTDAGAA
jgi:DNA segregation ATPase FtsK/SpoIIIE, S-DNA-T family